MTTWEPDMAFRGKRKYLHSTDLYETLLDGCVERFGPPSGRVALTIRRPLLRQPCFVFSHNSDNRPGNVAADFRVDVGSRLVSGWVAETDRPVMQRKEYDETPIWEASRVENKTASLKKPVEVKPIEAVTALGVLLHNMTWKPVHGERWMLGRIDMVRPLCPADLHRLTITVTRCIGARITRSSIYASGANLGEMDFMLSSVMSS